MIKSKINNEFGNELEKRMLDISEKVGLDAIKKCQEVATIGAVQEAVANTPPNLEGTADGNATGTMSNSWHTDSITKPNDKFETYLVNNMQYASFVNDGHRLDKHFVPHLFLLNGKFHYNPSKEGGIMVGVRTQYIKGYYMKEKAIRKFEERFEKAINQTWEKASKK